LENLANIFGEFNSILAICPNPDCGEITRLSDVKPYLAGAKPTTKFDRLERQLEQLDRVEAVLEEKLTRLREKAQEQGWQKARAHLKSVDPCFCGCGLEPKDVKVVFDPVEYVVFDGMTDGFVKRVLLVCEEPADRRQEHAQQSIQNAVKKGNLDFVTLRVTNDGRVEKE
jgi:predicted Holliday junction resolvase-like endonuclease